MCCWNIEFILFILRKAVFFSFIAGVTADVKKKKKNKVRTSDCRRRTSMLNYFELKDIMNGLRDYFHCVWSGTVQRPRFKCRILYYMRHPHWHLNGIQFLNLSDLQRTIQSCLICHYFPTMIIVTLSFGMVCHEHIRIF